MQPDGAASTVMAQHERAVEYIDHVIAVHGGRWSLNPDGANWRVEYGHPGANAAMLAYVTATKSDAIVCLAFGLHAQLPVCRTCPTLARLMVRDA